jgi:hypothetical protein
MEERDMVFLRKSLLFFCFILVCTTAVSAQSLRSMTFNGSTGLFTIPSGYTSWRDSAKQFGADVGYHGILNTKPNHLINLNLGLFRWLELNISYDFQYNYYEAANMYQYNKNNDLIVGAKLEIPSFENTAIGVGGNVQFLNVGENVFSPHIEGVNRAWGGYYIAAQAYAALTYSGSFLGNNAETSVMIGKSFYKDMDSSIDFGMGLDVGIFPEYLHGLIHVIIDFSNFTYTDSPNPLISDDRGILNAGFRLDLSAIPPLSKIKLTVDALITDGFDRGRSFALGAVFGVPL